MGTHVFKTEALLLVLPTTEYQKRVPVTIGTSLTDMAVDSLDHSDTTNLPTSWKTVCYATKTRRQIQAQQVQKPTVKTTKPITLPPFSTTVVHGHTKLKGHGLKLNLIAEPFKNSQLPSNIQCTPTYCTLEPGSNRVTVGLRNISARKITVPSKTILCQIQLANIIPPMNTSTDQTPPEEEQVDDPCIPNHLDLGELSTWTKEQQYAAKKLLCDYADTFSKNDLDLGKCNILKHNIQLTDQQPFKERYRRIPPHLFEEVKQHLQEMVEVGAIRKSFSPWASAVVLVRKKDGGLRLCIDLRKLNNRTIKDGYSLPRIDDTLDCLHGAKWFSTLDLKSGYWQVELEEEAKPLTAFTMGPLGFWECERMPFGLTNAPATFQRLMESCLGELNLSWCIIYLDDIIVFSQTPEEHLVRLQAVFDKLKAAGLKLKPSKCELFKKQINYLGHVVGQEGVSTDPDKIKAVTEWPRPTTVTEVRSFLGFVSYYRRFIPNFSKVAKPLNTLLQNLEGTSNQKKKFKVNWGPDQQEAFETLQRLCTEAPILAYADFKTPFILHTDASSEGLGAVLYQYQDNQRRVIAYASRSLSPSERNYPTHKLEFLALKWAITDKFHEYLYGAEFQVFTDNNPLTYILTTAKLDATGHRWVAALSNYTFSISYKPGRNNTDADALSRIQWPEAVDISSQTVQAVCEGVQALHGKVETLCHGAQSVGILSQDTMPAGMTSLEWSQAQMQDPAISQIIQAIQTKTLDTIKYNPNMSSELKAFLRIRKQFKLKHGVLYRKTQVHDKARLQLVLPPSYRSKAMAGCHDLVGHLGQDRVLELLRDRFFWPGMHMDVASYINSCPRCIRRKTQPDTAPLHNIEATQPLELVHLDYLQIEPSKGNIENVLIVTDHFTRYAQAYPSKTQTALATAKLLWNNFIIHYGFPNKIISDQGRNFESELLANLCEVAGVQKLRTTPYHPQTNGQCERFNSTLLNMLGTLTPEQKKDWKTYVPAMVHAYNCTRNTATGYSPYYLLFGREPRLPIDVEFGLKRGNQQNPPSKSTYVTQLRRRLRYAHKKAKQVADKQQARHKELYDRRCRGAALDIGDLVLVKKTAWKGKHKIQDRWESDEYQVIEQPTPGIPVYKVKCIAGGRSRVLHHNLLLPLQGRLRQSEGQVGIDTPDPEEEEEEDSRLPGAPQAPQAQVGKGPSPPQTKPTKPTPPSEASKQDASDESSRKSSTSKHVPERLLTLDSSDDEVYTDSLTSHTTASDSTTNNLTSLLEPSLLPTAISRTESQFSSSMPYLEGNTSTTPSTPSIDSIKPSSTTVSNRPNDSVFASDPSSETQHEASSPELPMPIPRRSTRSTKGKPPERYGNIYAFDTIVDMGSHFICPCDYCQGR